MTSLLLLPLLALLGLQSVETADPGTSHLIRVRLDTQPRARALLDRAGFLSCVGEKQIDGGRYVDVVVAHEEWTDYRGMGIDGVELARGRPYRDIVASLRKLGPLAPDARYFTVAEIETELSKLAKSYPKLARRVDLTAFTGSPKTFEGRRLYALVISDNVSNSEDEPTVLIASQHHARELNVPYVSIVAARRLLAGYATSTAIQKVVDENEIWIVPCVNPDGVAYVWARDNMWRKNRRKNSSYSYGVDLNRNYPYEWGKCGSTSSRSRSSVYRGPSAGSEPEIKTMMALARKMRFERYLDFHSYGREILTTFSPCVQRNYASTAWAAMELHHRKILMATAGFKTRMPSASGEAMEFHAAENGSLSYLVEIGTSFQPAFPITVAEEKRTWPLILRFLQMRPAIRAHVRSLKGKTPLASATSLKVLGLRRGESFRSPAATGRLHLWLPPGKRPHTVSASGHVSKSFQLQAARYEAGTAMDLVLVPTLPSAILSAPLRATLGKPALISFSAGDPGRSYWIAMSLGSTPGFPIPPRVVPLNPDALFFTSSVPLAPIYTGQLGKLDARGKAKATLTLPRHAAFHGLKLWFCGLTFEPGWPFGVKSISSARQIELRL